jgi:Tol biopolymer transport system component
MLTGAPPHQGDTSQETMASILRDEANLDKVPAQARRLLKRCLEKDPQKRLRHIGDVMALLDEPLSGQSAPAVDLSGIRTSADATASSGKKWLWPSVALGAVAIVGVLTVWAPWRSQTTALQAVRFEVGESDKMKFIYGGAMALSPDGHWMVFPATGEDGITRYWVRSLDTVESRALPGTESAYVPASWSADSRFVIFTPISSAQIKKVDIQGGPPQILADFPSTGRLNGASANKDGVIIFASSASSNQPVFRIPAAGGTPVPVTAPARGETHRWPQFLPDGRHFLYVKASVDPDQMGAYIGSIDDKPEAQNAKRVLATNRQTYYAGLPGGGPGHLVFLREATLMTQAFDPVRMELSGEAIPIAEGVDSFPGQNYGLFSTSESGALVYRGGAEAKLALTWFDDKGNAAGAFEPGDYANMVLSPDQTRIALAVGQAGSRDVWIVDVARKTNTRLTFDPANDDNPVWSPDGKHIAFSSNRSGQSKLYLKPADGSGEERLMTDQPGVPTSWSSDGRFLLFTSNSPKTGNDIWVLPDPGRPSGEAKPQAILETQFSETQAHFSPDGRWIAYTSSESSPSDVYIRPFAPDGSAGAAGAKWLVSRRLGGAPRWRADGKQLFFAVVNTFDVMVVDIDTSKGFQAGTPRRLFSAPPPLLPVGWDVAPDGKRFLFITTPNGGRPAPFTVVLNWAAALKK